jgi:formiminotetrahydrofolate cyclodeaminase
MVTGITLAKLEKADTTATGQLAELHEVAASAQALDAEFRRLESEDMRAFESYVAALKLPRSSAEEKARRDAARLEAVRKATAAPLATCEAALAVFGLARRLLSLASGLRLSAESDLGGAVELAHAAFRTAELTVRVNLPGLKAAPERAAIEERFRGLLESCAADYGDLRRRVLELLEAGERRA